MAGETQVPFGTDVTVPLVKVEPSLGNIRFEPQQGVESSGGTIATRQLLEAPLRSDDESIRTPVTGQSLTSTSRSGTLPTYGLTTFAQLFSADPEQSNDFLRGTGGAVFGGGTGADAVLTNRQAPDVRSFLYGFNVTGSDGRPVQVNDAGELVVTTGASVASTITTSADDTGIGTVATQVAAANLNRRQVIVQNIGATNAGRVGDSAITTTRGIRLAPGESVTLEVTAAIFVLAEAGTTDFAVTEIVT